MTMEEFERYFNGRSLPRELIWLQASQQRMPDFAQGSALIEHDGSALTRRIYESDEVAFLLFLISVLCRFHAISVHCCGLDTCGHEAKRDPTVSVAHRGQSSALRRVAPRLCGSGGARITGASPS
ncbi:hypothetical protein ACFQ4Q_05890 [Lysobacter gummosus]|uniref:hypothetical protein n=1 Tax=Lysobacter gummosus TaxID=262324 RepID=UPI00362F5915